MFPVTPAARRRRLRFTRRPGCQTTPAPRTRGLEPAGNPANPARSTRQCIARTSKRSSPACRAERRGKTLYRYFPDRQALWLLARALDGAGEGARIADLRRGERARHLGRPAVKAIIAAKGDGVLTAADLEAAWPRRWQTYRLTLGRWGSASRRDAAYLQTSRPGWNLVLQMNFSKEHDAPFRRYVRDHRERPFEFEGTRSPGGAGGSHAGSRAFKPWDLTGCRPLSPVKQISVRQGPPWFG